MAYRKKLVPLFLSSEGLVVCLPCCLLVKSFLPCGTDPAFGGISPGLRDATWPSLQCLTFGRCFQQSLQGVALPCGLQSLTFGAQFNSSLQGVTFPSSLKSLTFGQDFDQNLQGVALPNSLEILEFGMRFNQSFLGVTLPGSLKSLTFGFHFNQILPAAWPSSLQSLTLGNDFNQELAVPDSLQRLTFGAFSNCSVQEVTWPSGLQSLTFGQGFNRSLEGVRLPGSLQSLTFGHLVAQWHSRFSCIIAFFSAKGCPGKSTNSQVAINWWFGLVNRQTTNPSHILRKLKQRSRHQFFLYFMELQWAKAIASTKVCIT